MAKPHWVSVKERLPEDNVEVLCSIEYSKPKCSHLALMYRLDGEWCFVGSNTSMRTGKPVKYWLADLSNPGDDVYGNEG